MKDVIEESVTEYLAENCDGTYDSENPDTWDLTMTPKDIIDELPEYIATDLKDKGYVSIEQVKSIVNAAVTAEGNNKDMAVLICEELDNLSSRNHSSNRKLIITEGYEGTSEPTLGVSFPLKGKKLNQPTDDKQ